MHITIEKFFDLEVAEFNVKPIMVFCGDNGTGKTHLIKLITNLSKEILDGKLLENVSDSEFEKAIRLFPIKDYSEHKFLLNERFEGDRLGILNKMICDKINNSISMEKDRILKDTFGKKLPSDTLKNIKVEFNPKEKIQISLQITSIKGNGNLKEDQEVNKAIGNLVQKLDSTIINGNDTIADEMQIFKLKEAINQMLSPNSLTGVLEIKTAQYVKKLGINISGDLNNKNKTFRLLIEFIIQNLAVFMYEVSIGIKSLTTDFYYLPASREAYHRDLEVFNSKFKENDSLLVSRYYINKSGEKVSTFSSDDPFIEKYIDDLLLILAKSGKQKINNRLKLFLARLEEDFFQAKVSANSKKLEFTLNSGNKIDATLASSLQNEYSFMRLLMEAETKPNLIIEEPEAHLSIKNASKLLYLLIAYQQFTNNILWITTHNNFIADAINNIVMLSQLPYEKQRQFLEKLKIHDVVSEFKKEFINNIDAYLLVNTQIEILPKDAYGIDFSNFTKQITYLADLALDIQLELESVE